jgi:hypothetical protein
MKRSRYMAIIIGAICVHLSFSADPALQNGAHVIAVNQVGYLADQPKRFTAPVSPDGSTFIVRSANKTKPLFEGSIQKKIGDFSAFQPPESNDHYVVEVTGGELTKGISDPFLIRPKLLQEQFWQSAVDFLIDTRSVVGTHPSAFGGCPWRDGTYYDAVIPSLVLFYLADRKFIDGMPRQIDWAVDKKRVMDPNFAFDANNPGSKGVMEAVMAYYEMEPPHPDAPDVVKMIHWGAGYYLTNPATQEHAGDPLGRKIHSQTIEQVSYVVWAWPALKKWLPQSFYERCRDLCFEHWEAMGALGIPDVWDPKTYEQSAENHGFGALHPFKGRHAPGHSIVPNLIMHEVAKREGRDDAARYLNAAVQQAAWCVENLDWNDPRTTKGHRMSEHRTIPNLAWLLQRYPDQAPPGLKEKIIAWAEVAIKRSNNLWDFRRYDMESHWTIPKMNDLGSTIGLPAIATAASWVVEDEAQKKRLKEISMAAVDHVFGRNPRLAAAPSRPQMGFPEVERGWPKEYKVNTCARLELCRGSLSSSPGSEMFPFNPTGDYRWLEGWVNYGAGWCISLAYLQADATGKTESFPCP